MKFLQTIRFDPSDTHVFAHAAEPGEWAISGSFWFSGTDQNGIKGKVKQAFSNGFLSLDSFGFSTFVSVTDITQSELDQITESLANKLVSEFGAPSRNAAVTAAANEVNYIKDMCCGVPVNSVFAVRRELDETGELRESFSLVELPTQRVHTKVWEIVE